MPTDGHPAVKPFWSPLVAGIAMGLVLILTFSLSGHGVGASGAVTHMVAGTGLVVATEATKANAYLVFERGPEVDVQLQWATYYDAADQAGQSRIFGGIHILPDDYGGRRIGRDVGLSAYARAKTYWNGTAR